jgi:hypothetical protein
MKNLLLGLALVGLTFACNTDQTAQMSDALEATPAACATGANCAMTDCDMAGKAGCDKMNKTAGCSASGASADAASKSSCSAKDKSAKVCPVTGEAIE